MADLSKFVGTQTQAQTQEASSAQQHDSILRALQSDASTMTTSDLQQSAEAYTGRPLSSKGKAQADALSKLMQSKTVKAAQSLLPQQQQMPVPQQFGEFVNQPAVRSSQKLAGTPLLGSETFQRAAAFGTGTMREPEPAGFLETAAGKTKEAVISASEKAQRGAKRLATGLTESPAAGATQALVSPITGIVEGAIDPKETVAENIKENFIAGISKLDPERAQQSSFDTLVGAVDVLNAGFEGAFSPVTGVVGTALETEAGQEVLQFISENVSDDTKQKFAQMSTYLKENPDVATLLEGALNLTGVGAITKGGRQAIKQTGKAIAETAPQLAKGAAAAITKPIDIVTDFTKSGKDIIKARNAGKAVDDIAEKLMPKLTKAQAQEAVLGKGLVQAQRKGFLGRLFGTERAVSPSDKLVDVAKTVQEKIPNFSKMDITESAPALKAQVKAVADDLRPDLQQVRVSKGQFTDDLDNILTETIDDIKIEISPRARTNQKKFEKSLDKFLNDWKGNKKITLDDIWELRKTYDDVTPNAVKSAGKTASGDLQIAKEAWLSNRSRLNDILFEVGDQTIAKGAVKDAFKTMSNLLTAETSLLSHVTASNLAGIAGKLSSEQLKRLAKIAAAGFGVGAAAQVL